MSETMLREQFEAQLPKIVTGILAAYKRDKTHLPITQARRRWPAARPPVALARR
jgi:hypothetical protein